MDLVPGEDSLVLEIVEATGSDHGAVLRRLSSWQREFGVDSILIELDGREYVMSKTRPRQTLVSAG